MLKQYFNTGLRKCSFTYLCRVGYQRLTEIALVIRDVKSLGFCLHGNAVLFLVFFFSLFEVKVAASMQPHYFPPTYSTLCIYALASCVRALAGVLLTVLIRACASPSLLTERPGERARSRRDSALMRVYRLRSRWSIGVRLFTQSEKKHLHRPK